VRSTKLANRGFLDPKTEGERGVGEGGRAVNGTLKPGGKSKLLPCKREEKPGRV